MAVEAGVVQAPDLHPLALGGVLGLDGVQRRHGGGVPDVRVGHVDDHVLGVAGVVELVDQIVAGGEEQLAADLVDPASVVLGDVDDLGEVGHPPGEHHHGDEHADDDADREVVGERR